MKFRTSLLILVLLLSITLHAQHRGDSFPEQYSGIIANFNDFTWKVIDCTTPASFEVVNDPAGANELVGKVITTDCTSEGIVLDRELDLFDFSVYNLIKVQVYAPDLGRTMCVKIQAFNNADISFSATAQTTVSKKWETLFFDFSEAENDPNISEFKQISLLPDYGAVNTNEEWYFTHIQYGRPPISYKENNGVLLDFEENLPFLYYWTCQGQANDVEFVVVDNPYPSGINTSGKVAQFVNSSLCAWEGFGICDKYEPFNFNERWVFKLKVFAPDVNREVGLKLEKWEDNEDNPLRIISYTTTAYEWEEMTFDVFEAVQDPDTQFYTRLVIFPDYHSTESGEYWYFDDIRFINPFDDTKVEKSIPVNDYKLTAINYPNPFNPFTTIEYTIPNDAHVLIIIYNVNCEEVETVVDELKTAGSHKYYFDGSKLTSGVYFYKVKTNREFLVRKLLLIK